MIAKPGNKTAAVLWPDPYTFHIEIRNTKYEIFIASGTNIKYMETTCNKDMENDKQN